MSTPGTGIGRFFALGTLVAGLGYLATTEVSLATPAAPATIAQDADTEDVIYMRDGRVLRGQILEQNRFVVRFEMINRDLGTQTIVPLMRDQILRIEENVAIKNAGTGGQGRDAGSDGGPNTGNNNSNNDDTLYDPNVPGLYVVPIEGQIGTDIMPSVYEPIIRDIKERKPEAVIFRFNTNALEHNDMPDFAELRQLVDMFKQELKGIRQVVWIENSIGTGTVVAMSWPEIYMMPDARLDGLSFVHVQTAGWQDDDVRAKMQAAWSGIAKGFLEIGGYDMDLAEAMMFPQHELSATFKGRKVEWTLDQSGEVVADTSSEMTVGFNAEDARNLLISDETVDRLGSDGLADLAFILGYREYRRVEGIAEVHIEEYVTEWRETYDFTRKRWDDYAQAYGGIGGGNAQRNLGLARAALGDVITGMRRFKAVEKMWESHGFPMYAMENRMNELRERAREIRERERERNSGGRGRGGGNGPAIPGGGG